jgi:hypothetical protein
MESFGARFRPYGDDATDFMYSFANQNNYNNSASVRKNISIIRSIDSRVRWVITTRRHSCHGDLIVAEKVFGSSKSGDDILLLGIDGLVGRCS